MGDINMPTITKVESLKVKDETGFCNYEDNSTAEKCCEIYPVKVKRESSSCPPHELATRNICFETYNDEEQTDQKEINQDMNPAVDGGSIGKVEIKDESFAVYDDNITIEEWNPDPQNGLINNNLSTRKPNYDGETEQKQVIFNMHHITTLLRTKIIDLYEQNLSISAIARRLKISRNTVQLWVHRYAAIGNIDRRRPGPQAVAYTNNSSRHREIVAAHMADPFASTRAIATKYKCSLQTVRNHLRASGLKCSRPEKKN